MPTHTLTPASLRTRLIAHHGLNRPLDSTGTQGARDLLLRLRMIQLDPLDPIGTNADLVAAARVDDLQVGQIYQALMPGYAFEHFAKERCLLPADAFPVWRDLLLQSPWWRMRDRLKKLDPGLIAAVLDEVVARGPITTRDLADQGRVQPMDWSGWSGTQRATTLALEVLWTRCQVVVCGRAGRNKLYDIPERALPHVHSRAAPSDPELWLLEQRIAAAGLLPHRLGPWWGGLRNLRKTGLPGLIDEGRITEVQLKGSRRRWLAMPGWLDQEVAESDERMRILGPLDPFLWDRRLVESVFDFTYLWEVYKPAQERRWGWYVCPLLHRGALVGRIEARVREGVLDVDRVWPETTLDRDALQQALVRHAAFLGVEPAQLR